MPTLLGSDGCRLYYERSGTGEPTVLIPGLGGDGRFWNDVVDLLSHRFDCLVVDHRGAGRCDRPPGPYTIDRIAQDVLEIMEAEDIGAAHLIGHSTGGAVVQTLALEAPEKARQLVISGSWAKPDAQFRILFAARKALLEAGQPEIYQHLTHVFGYAHEWLSEHEVELAAAAAGASTTLAPLEVSAARIQMLLDFDRSLDLPNIRQRTLVVGGTDDMLVPFRHSAQIAALIPGAQLRSLDGGHFFPRVYSRAFADLLMEFLSLET